MRNILLPSILFFAFIKIIIAQNIGINTLAPDSSAMLDITSIDKGLLIPRMTIDERDSITKPAFGLIIFNTTDTCINIWSGNFWYSCCCSKDASSPHSFNCGDDITDNRDSKVYKTVQIGTQCWFVENLNYGTMIGSKLADDVTMQEQTNNSIPEKYCYGYVKQGDAGQIATGIANCSIYGGLYQWAEAMQYKDGCSNTTLLQPTLPVQGICPKGWHVPGDAEWTTLTTYLGGQSVAGGKLKETGTTHWQSPNAGATNESGFTALPGGYRSLSGPFEGIGNYGYWLSSTESNISKACGRGTSYSSSEVYYYLLNKLNGYSVRCIKD